MKKQHLPTKICPVCEKPFTWRKKWEKNWDDVKYCSERCGRRKKPARPMIALIPLILMFFYGASPMAKQPTVQNILGTPLKSCCTQPMTGFFRDGYCRTIRADHGKHVVCAVITKTFISFTKSRGNDLTTPRPECDFPGLKPGDKWCLCALRWREAHEAGVAPPLIPESTHAQLLKFVDEKTLKKYYAAPASSSPTQKTLEK